ncbi:MAG TPA: GMC family oxidoreductase N-terminal domain-containing protein [Gammaproteobacteria bacterium]
MTTAGEEFDYVVVGSGTAGCVVAARLSEDRDRNVCLIEAGPPDRSPLVHVPAAVGTLIAHKVMGWGYRTVPQPGLKGRSILVPRGRVLGGCSSTNGMVYFRGHPKDFDDWAAAGNPGWSFREVLPYFIRSEDNPEYAGSPFHGVGGPMRVAHIPRVNPLCEVFLEAAAGLGYPRCADFNGTLDPVGFNTRQGTIRNGRRESGVTAFIKPARNRTNLRIVTDALVTRVLLENRRAIGIEMNVGGESRTLRTRREVILAAGAIGSPQVLMLSGIGDGRDLNALGITVRHDLPAVGRHYTDHLAIGVLMSADSPESYGLSWRRTPRNLWHILEYLLFRRGPLGSNLFEATGFLRTEEGLDRPDVQLVFQPARRNKTPFPIPIGHGFAMNPLVLHPKSRGRVTLASPDPHAMPLIDPNLLGDERDIDPLVRSIVISRKIFAAEPFRRFNPVEYSPGPAVQDEAGLKDYIRSNAVTVHHPVSTCRMGPAGDNVVDAALRVHGIEGLRVADASVFPTLIGGNTNAAVVMVGEKAADLILDRPAPPAIDIESLEVPASA